MEEKKVSNLRLWIILGVLIVCLGTSVAFFTVGYDFNGSGTKVQGETGDFVEVTYDAGTSTLNLQDAVPGSSTTKDFSVKITPNKTKDEVTYDIKLNLTTNEFSYGTEHLQVQELKYTLTEKETGKVYEGYIPLGTTGDITLKQFTKQEDAETTYNYSLKIEFLNIDADQNHNQNKSISGNLKVEFAEKNVTLAKDFLKSNASREDFESITTLDKINIPDNAIKSWDASEAENETVMAYYLDEDKNGLYELYLASEGEVIAPEDSSYLFSDSEYYQLFRNVTTLDLSKLDTSNVTNMNEMFSRMSNLTSINLSHFNTSNVTDMSYMFSGMSSITSLDLSNFDTSNVIYMFSMFTRMSSITSLDVSNFNTSKVTNMSGMFTRMSSLTSLDLSSFDTSNVTNMNSMFSEMSSLTSLDISSFDTSNVTNMNQMFWYMSNLTSIDVSNFDTSKVTNMYGMFNRMSSLTSLDLSSFDTSNVTNMNSMFSGMRNLTSLDISKADFSKVTSYWQMFNAPKLNTIQVKNEAAKTFIEARLADVSLTGVTVNPVS